MTSVEMMSADELIARLAGDLERSQAELEEARARIAYLCEVGTAAARWLASLQREQLGDLAEVLDPSQQRALLVLAALIDGRTPPP